MVIQLVLVGYVLTFLFPISPFVAYSAICP